jgi:hypothetical protein
MADGEGMGLGTVVSAILILIVVGGIIWAINIGAFGNTRDAFDEFSDISDEVFTEEDDLELIETHRLAEFIVRSLDTEEDDCLVDLNLDDFNGFDIGFENDKVEVSTKDGKFVVIEELDENVAFNNLKEFVIKESVSSGKFDQIQVETGDGAKVLKVSFDGISIEDGIYYLDRFLFFKSPEGKSYLLDDSVKDIFEGTYHSTFAKDICGFASVPTESISIERIEVNTNGDPNKQIGLRNYLSSEISYFGVDYELYDFLNYLFKLDQRKEISGLENKQKIDLQIDYFSKILSNHIEFVLDNEFLGPPVISEDTCWDVDVKRYDTIATTENLLFTYGGPISNPLRYSTLEFVLPEGDVIRLDLFVASSCLSAVEREEYFLAQYRGSF